MGRDDLAMTTPDAQVANTPPISALRDDAAPPALSIGGVSHSYGARRALIDVGFTVAPASFTAACTRAGS